MASGANVTVTGGTTMRQVVAVTDTIEIADFNNPRTNINTLLGTANAVTLGTYTASNTYGYGQGGASVGAASSAATILASGTNGAFKVLQDDVQALCAFLGQTLRTGVGTDVTTSTTITAATWSNLMLNVKDCWDNRFSPASRTATTDTTATRSTSWVNSLTQVTTWTFADAASCRAYFNGGGALGVSASRSGGHTRPQNTSWTNLLNAIGDVFIYHNTTTAGAGTLAGLGFYNLTTTFQQMVIYFGGATNYTSDHIRVRARVNSTTAPTEVIIETYLEDAGDNVIDDNVDGTLTINARRNRPDASGSGFTFATPSVSAAAISGS
jgi:hypothetical protein